LIKATGDGEQNENQANVERHFDVYWPRFYFDSRQIFLRQEIKQRHQRIVERGGAWNYTQTESSVLEKIKHYFLEEMSERPNKQLRMLCEAKTSATPASNNPQTLASMP